MNKEQFAGQWKILKPKLQAKWAKLSEDELAQVSGKREHLLNLIQRKYGLDRSAVEEELVEIESSLTLSSAGPAHRAAAPGARSAQQGQRNPQAGFPGREAPSPQQPPRKEKGREGGREKVKQGDKSPF